jgi:hypothetical protein
MIPVDFVPGTHGHFLAYVLNRSFGHVTQTFEPFTDLGTSHVNPRHYELSKEFVCRHWFMSDPATIMQSPKVIRVTFDRDDLLIVSTLSLLRASDSNIDCDLLEKDTRKKLNTDQYRNLLETIYFAYPDLDQQAEDIPRNILREFFKHSFSTNANNGHWHLQQQMLAVDTASQFCINLKEIYQYDLLAQALGTLSTWLDRTVDFEQWLPDLHDKFLARINCLHHQKICEDIIGAVLQGRSCAVPPLTLLQESYINARLESIFHKEMPFHQDNYFTHTKDMLYYINHVATKL